MFQNLTFQVNSIIYKKEHIYLLLIATHCEPLQVSYPKTDLRKAISHAPHFSNITPKWTKSKIGGYKGLHGSAIHHLIHLKTSGAPQQIKQESLLQIKHEY